MAAAHHFREENNHPRLLDNLTILLQKDGKYWFAQSMEINYFAYGKTVEETKERFKKGLIETVKANLEKYGSIVPLLEWAPPHVLNKYHEGNYVKNGDIPVDEPILPIGNLRFIKPMN